MEARDGMADVFSIILGYEWGGMVYMPRQRPPFDLCISRLCFRACIRLFSRSYLGKVLMTPKPKPTKHCYSSGLKWIRETASTAKANAGKRRETK